MARHPDGSEAGDLTLHVRITRVGMAEVDESCVFSRVVHPSPVDREIHSADATRSAGGGDPATVNGSLPR